MLLFLAIIAGCDNKDFSSDMKPADIINNMVHIKSSSYDFYIGKYEVTQDEWLTVMDYNPSRVKGKNRPVESVKLSEVLDFIARLKKETGLNYSLPTTSQWKYAAGQNAESTYSGGDNINELAWYKKNSGGTPHEVGKKAPNSFGLYDMSGNVMEFCSYRAKVTITSDRYETRYSLYGGCWNDDAEYCTISSSISATTDDKIADYNSIYYDDYRVPVTGFRLVLTK